MRFPAVLLSGLPLGLNSLPTQLHLRRRRTLDAAPTEIRPLLGDLADPPPFLHIVPWLQTISTMADHMGIADMAEVGIDELDEYPVCTSCYAPIFNPEQLNCKTCRKALIGPGCERSIRPSSKDRGAQSEVAWAQERQGVSLAELAAILNSDDDDDVGRPHGEAG